MPPCLACTAALVAALATEPATSEPAATTATSAALPTAAPAEQPRAGYLVRVDLGPALARRMGIRVIVRPAGESFGNRRSAVALDLPRPATAEAAPAPASLQLPAGLWLIEATAPGFLPSTREFTVDATRPEQTLQWPLLPDSAHADVRFPVAAPGAPGVALSVRSTAGDARWTCTLQREDACTLRLPRGEWVVEARAAGFTSASETFVVAPNIPISVPLSLAPAAELSPRTAPRPTIPPNMRKRLVLGLGLASAPVFAAGLGLAVAGRLQYAGQLYGDACDGSYRVGCANALYAPVHRTSAGLGLLGAAAGLLATGITGAFGVGRGVWLIELSVGGVLTAAGAGWIAGNSVFLDRAYRSGPLSDVVARADRRLGASMTLGLGAGVMVGALTGLLMHRRHAPKLAPYAAPGQAGVVWSGRF